MILRNESESRTLKARSNPAAYGEGQEPDDPTRGRAGHKLTLADAQPYATPAEARVAARVDVLETQIRQAEAAIARELSAIRDLTATLAEGQNRDRREQRPV